ncbi:hypothetical protein Anas_01724 [Armadillidium nasatum]|uniref:Uncharacterized protein n=1 Tax=Armadillidium nasatum TaxID=96803 RepID=A0A5N5T777_9CRUS|nr:hypothetical protein Anas_01724 [Armadillidium nasatum]
MFHDPKTISIKESVNDRRSSLLTLSCLKGRWGYVNCSTDKMQFRSLEKRQTMSQQLSITFKVIPIKEGFNLLSFVQASVSTNKNVTPPTGQLFYSKEIEAHFIPGYVPAQPLALWIYIVAVLCGLLLLLIIVY